MIRQGLRERHTNARSERRTWGEHDNQESENLFHPPGITDRVASKRCHETGFPADWDVLELLGNLRCRDEDQTY